MKLYDFQLSGNAYKVTLFLSLLAIDYERIAVDLAAGEQKRPEFLARNPDGTVPVLEDDGRTIPGSHGILIYLAKGHDEADQWLPEDGPALAEVVEWLGVVSDDVTNGLGAARLVKLFGAVLDYAAAVARADKTLAKLDRRLTGRDWLASNRPTIADVAMYPYVKTAADGEVSMNGHDNVAAWLARVESLPGYIAMDG